MHDPIKYGNNVSNYILMLRIDLEYTSPNSLIFFSMRSCHQLGDYIYIIMCLKSVAVRKLQVAILARSPREMSQTDRILPRYILSRVRVSVRPRIFYTRKNPKPDSPACCLFQDVYGFALRPGKQLNWKLQNRPSWVASR